MTMVNHSTLMKTKPKSVKTLAGYYSIIRHNRVIRVGNLGRVLYEIRATQRIQTGHAIF